MVPGLVQRLALESVMVSGKVLGQKLVNMTELLMAVQSVLE